MASATLSYPEKLLLSEAQAAWGVSVEDLEAVQKPSSNTNQGPVWNSYDIKKFLAHTTKIVVEGKRSAALQKFFRYFMLMSLEYPLTENTSKAVLQLLKRDYLNEEDFKKYQSECERLFNHFKERSNAKELLIRYEKDPREMIAGFPRGLLIESLNELLSSRSLQVRALNDPNPDPSQIDHMFRCANAMHLTLILIPIADEVSRTIIESNPLFQATKPMIGFLKLKKPMADQHTVISLGR